MNVLTYKKTEKILFLCLGVAVLAVMLSVFVGTDTYAARCGDIETSFDYGCEPEVSGESGDLENNPIYFLLLYAVNFLAAGVGIAAVGFIVWGSIMYAGSDGSPETAKKGISYITNAVIGLILFLAMYALINYLVPGGLLN